MSAPPALPNGHDLDGARAILRHLRKRHGISISRQTLHRLRTTPTREFSCSDIAESPTPFPAETVFNGQVLSLVATAAKVDAWVTKHRRVPAGE